VLKLNTEALRVQLITVLRTLGRGSAGLYRIPGSGVRTGSGGTIGSASIIANPIVNIAIRDASCLMVDILQ